jgi:hypothetical protein
MPKQRESAKAFRQAVAWSLLVLLSLATLCCGGSGSSNSGTSWVGTFSQPDAFGGGYGTIRFIVEPNNTVFCIQFSGPGAPDQMQFDTSCKNPATESFPIAGNQFSIP